MGREYEEEISHCIFDFVFIHCHFRNCGGGIWLTHDLNSNDDGVSSKTDFIVDPGCPDDPVPIGNYSSLSKYYSDLRNWTVYSQTAAFKSMTYNSMTNESEVVVSTASGWEYLTLQFTVTKNTIYNLSFDFIAPTYTPLSGFDGLGLMVLYSAPNNNSVDIMLGCDCMRSSCSGTAYVSFNSGNYTSIYIALNFGYLADGQNNLTFKFSNFYMDVPLYTDYWIDAGNYSTTPWQGSGTESDPWLIKNEKDLARLSYLVYNGITGYSVPDIGDDTVNDVYVGKYFKQTSNIDMSAHYWQPIGLANKRDESSFRYGFSGVYDGNGYTIDGLFTPNTAANHGYENQGLFGLCFGYDESNLCIIKNVTLGSKSHIKGWCNIGGIVGGCGEYTKILNCKNYANVTASRGGVCGIAGGYFFGDGNLTSIEDCINYGNITMVGSVSPTGGISAMISRVTIKNCINYGKVIGSNEVGGIVGLLQNNGIISNCQNYGNIIGATQVGGITGNIANNGKIIDCVNYADIGFSDNLINYPHYDWEGTGTNLKLKYTYADNVYSLIPLGTSDPRIPTSLNAYLESGKTYLVSAIPKNESGVIVDEIEIFYGLNGAYGTGQELKFGKTEGSQQTLTVSTTGTYYLRFDNDYSGTVNVYNLYIKEIYVPTYVGGICGDAETSNILDCINHGSITGNEKSSGIAGNISSNSLVKNCINKAKIIGQVYASGVTGRAVDSEVNNCVNYGIVLGTSTIAGVCGDLTTSSALNCINYANITGGSHTSGVVGYSSYGLIRSCVNKGNIKGGNTSAGVLGNNNNYSIMYNCINYGSVSGAHQAGGVCANTNNHSEIYESINYGTVTSGSSRVAGIAGNVNSSTKIMRCANYGSISGAEDVGGIAGGCFYATNIIKDCYNRGSVKSTSSVRVGGICGIMQNNNSTPAVISNCYNTGTISSVHSDLGGIVGDLLYNSGPTHVYNCINLGNVTSSYSGGGTLYIGSIMAAKTSANNHLRNCYWLSGTCSTAYGTGSSNNTSNISNITKFTDTYFPRSIKNYINNSNWYSGYYWDFENTWTFAGGVNDGYPILRFEMSVNFDTNGGDELEPMTGYYAGSVELPTPTRAGYTFAGWIETADVLHDGSTFARVFYHNNQGGTNLFVTAEEVEKTNSEMKYSMLREMDMLTEDGYDLFLEYDIIPGYNYWHQDLNPLDEYVVETSTGGKATGYIPYSLSWTGNYFGGLTRQHNYKNNFADTYLAGSVGHAQWYYAIGVFSKFKFGIPGVNDGSTDIGVSVWMKLDSLDCVSAPIGYQGGERFYFRERPSTLTALWIPNTYSVFFDPNSGVGEMSKQTLTYETSATLSPNEYTKTGYSFVGWALSKTDAESGTITYADCAEVLNLAHGIEESATLYAVWQANSFDVVFNGISCTGSMSNQHFVYDEAQTLAQNTFAKVGYNFAGWATSYENANNKIVKYLDGEEVLNITTLEEINLYSVWTPINYQIKFIANGGTGAMLDQAFVYDVAQEISENQFARLGYKFVGWSRDQADAYDGIVEFVDQEEVSNITINDRETVVLYAVWQEEFCAKYSSDSYWYVEVGYMPQGRVNQSLNATLNNLLATNSEELYASGNIYNVAKNFYTSTNVMTTVSLAGYYYSGVEYCVYKNNQWYKVEPIRWRLSGRYSVGDKITLGTDAVLETIVFAGAFSSGTTDYSIDSVDAFSYNLSNNGSNMSNLSVFTPADLAGREDKIYIASANEIQTIAGSFDVKFSDLVCDIIGTRYYYTRTLANDGNIKVYSYLGFASAAYPTYQYGVQFIIKLSEFVCI